MTGFLMPSAENCTGAEYLQRIWRVIIVSNNAILTIRIRLCQDDKRYTCNFSSRRSLL